MLLHYSLGLEEEAEAIEAAVEGVLEAGYRTRDILEEGAKLVGTREMGDAVVAELD
jgi:3-isopropylmalate dehydrogenase